MKKRKRREIVPVNNGSRTNVGAPILYRYSCKITIFDANGNVIKREEKLFRLHREARDYAKQLKAQHSERDIISLIDVIKLSEGRVVENYKSKNLQKHTRRRR